MPSKKQTHSNDKGGKKKRSPKPATKNLGTLAQRKTHPATLIRRAQLDRRSLTSGDVLQLQRTIGNQAVGQLLAQTGQCQPNQRKQNDTGLPDNLKTGIENLSGYSMEDVRVHYNSRGPAQLHALAYTQGRDIHLASGQEKHLGHEAWHVVQQKQGRVKPTLQMKGTAINDDNALEKEADAIGAQILKANPHPSNQAQLKSSSDKAEKEPAAKGTRQDIVQMAGWDEFLRKHRLRTGAPQPFRKGKIMFASVKDGKVGSIYFPDARIRLIHNNGPQISKHPEGVKHYTLPPSDLEKYQKWFKDYKNTHGGKRPKSVQRFHYVTGILSRPIAKAGDAGKLIEFFDDGKKGSHKSRGEPQKFTTIRTQKQLDIVYNAAGTNDNATLYDAMQGDRVLRTIRMNSY